MNLFYEEYPDRIEVNGEEIKIVTDFREYVKLIDMLKDTELNAEEKFSCIEQYLLQETDNVLAAIEELIDFMSMAALQPNEEQVHTEKQEKKKDLFSFSIDYPFIFSAFLHCYGINIRTIPYMHWWEFKLLFDGLPETTEIKQRIMYRSIDLNEIKDKEERKRISKIQRMIQLPQTVAMNDFEIADAFGW